MNRRWLAPVLFALGCGGAPGRTVRATGSGLDSLVAIGEQLFDAERYDSARAVWTGALATSRVIRDDTAEARLLARLGLVTWRLGDVGRAATLARQALAGAVKAGPRAEPARAHLVLGLTALDEGQNREAIGHFEAAAATARSAGDSATTARAMGGLGNTYTYLGDLGRGRQYQRAQRELARRIGNRRLEGNGLLNEAMIDIWQGNPRPAIARVDTARTLYRQAGYATGEQHALGQLATAYELTGEEDLALAALDSSLATDRRLGLKQEEADQLRLIAGIHVRLGDYRRALRYYEQAEALIRAGRFESNLGAVLRGQALVHARLGNYQQAQRAVAEALRLHDASGEPLDRLDDLLLAADVEYRGSGRAAAMARLDQARAIASAIKTRAAEIAVVLAEAQLADRANDPRAVLRVLAAGRPTMAGGDFGSDWLAHGLTARAYARIGSVDSAIAAGRRAVRATERLRSRLGSDAIRANFIADRASIYADLVLSLLRVGRTAEAFTVADGARSRGLLERLAESRTGAASFAPDLVASEQLLRRIDSLVQRMRESDRGKRPERGSDADAKRDPLVADLAAARGDYEALVTRAAQRTPRVTSLLGLQAVRLDQVQAALEPDQALLQYLITPSELVTFVVTNTTVRVVRSTGSPETLTERTRLIRDLWGAPGPDWQLGLPAARALYGSLIEPAQRVGALDGIWRLLIVPQGILGQVPFAALQNPTTHRFLGEDFGLIHLPSAGAMTAFRKNGAMRATAVGPGSGFAPFPVELPATKTEVLAIRAAMPGVQTRIGAEATETAVRLALGQPGFVHLASHGVLNARNPLFSSMELVRSPNRLDGDGRLEAHEILGLQIRSALVFFSGCETGAGREWTDDPVWGTGDLTLAQAVLAAGAENVIMTLWRIDDAGAAAFAEHFYRGLRRGSVVDAFSAAQRATMADPRYSSPYYWASYVLSGNGTLTGR
jgi:CHAT domain-containing protein/tetratricopeptide (TPR) repeat protein